MYKIVFYKDEREKCEIKEYLEELQSRKDKNSRIKANKIISYINMLSKYGTNLGDTYIKHLQEDIWELRPLRDRILFAFVRNNKIVLLTIFIFLTQKTPKSELERAKKVLKKFIERGDESE